MTGRFLLIRDLQVAEDIGARAKLGWFDVEFNFFGTAYEQAGEEYYLISSNPIRIYDFIAEQCRLDIYCSPVDVYVKKCPVPSGTEDLIARDIKLLLGKQLQRKYTPDFLQDFQETFRDIANDGAKDILEAWQEQIDGLFDQELLGLFNHLVQTAYSAKVLKRRSYDEFQRWIQSVYADMGDDLIVKDVYRRDLYSLTYWDGGKRHTVINAQKDRLYVKAQELMKRGILSTPIYGKTYWYNHDYRLTDARKEYEAYLKSDLMEAFLQAADRINNLPSAIDGAFYQEVSNRWRQQYGEEVQDYLAYYQTKWHGEKR